MTFEKYFKAGEILKPEFDDIKKKLNREIEKDFSTIKEQIYGTHGSKYDEILYSMPTISNIKSFGKKIKKFDASNDIEKDAINFYYKYKDIAEEIEKLKLIVKTTTQKRAEQKEVLAKQMEKACSVDPLAIALSKFRAEFVKESIIIGNEDYDKHMKYLLDNGGIEQVAPVPRSSMTKSEYMAAYKKREFYSHLLRTPKEVILKEVEQDAFMDYNAWMLKMASKIGKPVIEATMTGDPWISSTLVVKTSDGESQSWYTQMIVNVSKYGKLFNQFPSRRFK